jgi:glycosyltransferase involved in cell wall biosynthesis
VSELCVPSSGSAAPELPEGGSAPLADANGSLPEHRLATEITLPFELPTPMYAAMLSIWHAAPGLQRKFPLHLGRRADHLRFLAWCVYEGRRRYAILRELPAWDEALNRRVPAALLEPTAWRDTMSVAMLLYGVARQQYSVGQLLASTAAQSRIAREWWAGKRLEHRGPPLAPWQATTLARAFKRPEALVDALRDERRPSAASGEPLNGHGLADLLAAFDRGRDGDVIADLAPTAGLSANLVKMPLTLLRAQSRLRTRLRATPDEASLARVMAMIPIAAPRPPRPTHPFGVNLFGYARGEIGIGEDVRMTARALQAADVPVRIINVQPGANVSQLDDSVAALLADEPLYAFNLFCITGKEHIRFVCEHGSAGLADRYNIGMWPWELPRWPASCEHAYAAVDELWGISRYTAQAYASAPCPVHAMPLCVDVSELGPQTRADFGLPEDRFLFVFSFDHNSTLTRKNPLAVVRAFQRAFPQGAPEPVGLVIKASHVKPEAAAWKALAELMHGDPRIHLINRTLRRPEVLALYKACDCYVSLHRAEGFGRGIAEALLLGKQVVATGFSGNMDFCDEGRVGLVSYRMAALAPTDYFHGEGQHWAEPSIEHAAARLREALMNKARPHGPTPDFGLASVGAAYGRRLLHLHERLAVLRRADTAIAGAPRTIETDARTS